MIMFLINLNTCSYQESLCYDKMTHIDYSKDFMVNFLYCFLLITIL